MTKHKNNTIKSLVTVAILFAGGLTSAASAESINVSDVSATLTQLTKTMDDTVKITAKAHETAQKHVAQKAKTVPQTAKVAEKSAAEKITETAMRYQGVPYVYGGTTPTGFDCSGFTSYVYREALGKEIGRTTWAQMGMGQAHSTATAQVGDVLVFFGGNHVGIYLGNGQFIHAPQPGMAVSVASLSSMPADYALSF
ncbi:C40 family peptidase [Lactococcus insecticola]|uniref:Hydrolase n=1 Tax=Pseudolactococcus insecticola TaxID=2709158 RepID=A0A6A0B3B6_9LACT|nr:C40 family peptidase [Lactococcus insecticola]GFH39810.1 hydrolase [Lactococcus insecticola]